MTKIVVRGGRTNVGLAERRVVPEEHEDLVKTSVKSALDVDVSRAGERDQPVIKDAADDDGRTFQCVQRCCRAPQEIP